MGPPVLGRQSEASVSEPALRSSGDATEATWRAEGASTPSYTLRAASVTGVRHRLGGRGCEDCFAWHHDGGVLAVAVADGLGSVDASAGAATRAARAAVAAALAKPLGSDRVGAAIRAADVAAAGGGATTLVVAVFDPGGQVSLGRVGDSTAFTIDAGGSWAEVFAVPDEDHVRTETAALPWSGDEDGPDIEPVECQLAERTVLVLASDGVSDPWRDGPATVAPALVEAILLRPSALEVARLADFSRQGCHDDRTLVCVWRRG
jgi:serine/threonine protein phosphatase PrpC